MPADPNVLLVVTDQERYDLTAPTGPEVDTPGADRLAAEGLRCDRTYTPTAICSPARVSILTGLYPHNHGVLSNPTREAIDTAVPEGTATMGERARAALLTPAVEVARMTHHPLRVDRRQRVQVVVFSVDLFEKRRSEPLAVGVSASKRAARLGKRRRRSLAGRRVVHGSVWRISYWVT